MGESGRGGSSLASGGDQDTLFTHVFAAALSLEKASVSWFQGEVSHMDNRILSTRGLQFPG